MANSDTWRRPCGGPPPPHSTPADERYLDAPSGDTKDDQVG
jgi:hypothetical protein